MKRCYHPASTTSRPLMMFIADHGLDVEMQVVDLFTCDSARASNETMDWINTQLCRDLAYGTVYSQIFPSHKRPTDVGWRASCPRASWPPFRACQRCQRYGRARVNQQGAASKAHGAAQAGRLGKPRNAAGAPLPRSPTGLPLAGRRRRA
jgi:hypothetical protein